MLYAVDYHPVSDSQVLAWENSSEPRLITLASGKELNVNSFIPTTKRKKVVSSSMSVADFLSRLGSGDTIYTELGGQNDKFCIAAFRQNAKLFRLPTWFIHDEQKRQRQEGKTGEAVESPVSIIYRFARDNPSLFYPFREVEDMAVLEVRLLSKMYWTVQRKIRIATANRLRHIQQDLELLGGLKGLPVANEAIERVLETLPANEEVELDFDTKGGVAVTFYKSLEQRLKAMLEARLEEMPLYQEVFSPVKGCGPGIAGYIISSIMDIRRFQSLPKLRAFAGYHLQPVNGGWQAPRRQKGQRANWNHILQQAVYYFTSVIDKQPVDNPWKQKLQTRYLVEVGKLLEVNRQAGKEIPSDMTVDQFLAYVAEERFKATAAGTIPKLPEPYKGIPAIARKRAMRWLGQEFLKYVWTEWRRLEGIT